MISNNCYHLNKNTNILIFLTYKFYVKAFFDIHREYVKQKYYTHKSFGN
jgi:hypothetical protein